MTLDGHQADDFKVQVSVTVFKCRDSKSGGGIAHEAADGARRETAARNGGRRPHPLGYTAGRYRRRPAPAKLTRYDNGTPVRVRRVR